MKPTNFPGRMKAKREKALEQVERRLAADKENKKAKYEQEVLKSRIDGAVGARSSRRNAARRGVSTS